MSVAIPSIHQQELFDALDCFASFFFASFQKTYARSSYPMQMVPRVRGVPGVDGVLLEAFVLVSHAVALADGRILFHGGMNTFGSGIYGGGCGLGLAYGGLYYC